MMNNNHMSKVRYNSIETHSLGNSRLDSSTLASNESKSYKDVDGAFPGIKKNSLLGLHTQKPVDIPNTLPIASSSTMSHPPNSETSSTVGTSEDDIDRR